MKHNSRAEIPELVTFIALHRGYDINNARMVAISTEPKLVAEFAERLLLVPIKTDDPVLSRVERGRRAALRVIAHASETPRPVPA